MAGGDDALDEPVFEPGPLVFIQSPEREWSDARLREHAEVLRELLQTPADPACLVPNARLALELLAERGISVDLVLTRPVV